VVELYCRVTTGYDPRRGSPEDLVAYRAFGKVLLRLLVEFPDGQAGALGARPRRRCAWLNL
jgi:hypothetical protein